MTHSPEPWKTDIWCDGPVCVIDANQEQIVGSIDSFDGFTVPIRSTTEDLNRITACVNACAGIPTERLVGLELRFATEAMDARDGGVENIDCSFCVVSALLEEAGWTKATGEPDA